MYGLSTAVFVVILVGIVLFSVILHEIMHGYVALWLGDDTAKHSGRLTLNPLKHIDPFATVLLPVVLALMHFRPFGAAKPVPVNFSRLKYEEFGMALVAISGPLTNFVLACLASLLFRATGADGLIGTIILLFISVNLSFFVFNMIPFPPLDGSRLLYALAPEPVQNFMSFIETMGLGAIFLFMLVIFPAVQPVMSSCVDSLLRILVG